MIKIQSTLIVTPKFVLYYECQLSSLKSQVLQNISPFKHFCHNMEHSPQGVSLPMHFALTVWPHRIMNDMVQLMSWYV